MTKIIYYFEKQDMGLIFFLGRFSLAESKSVVYGML